MNIGGKSLRVLRLSDSKDDSYQFLYNGKIYNIDFFTGSEEQYNLDHEVFNNFLASFTLN